MSLVIMLMLWLINNVKNKQYKNILYNIEKKKGKYLIGKIYPKYFLWLNSNTMFLLHKYLIHID
jgi:hypothetical protein